MSLKDKMLGQSDKDVERKYNYTNTVANGAMTIKNILRGTQNLEVYMNVVEKNENINSNEYVYDIVKDWLGINDENSNFEELNQLCEQIESLSTKLSYSLGKLNQINKKELAQKDKDDERIYNPTQAGEYIAEVIGRDEPIRKATVNTYIKQKKLKAFKKGKGNYNYIYKSDLDDFIKVTDFRNT